MLQQPYKILVVDDEPDMEPLFRQRLRRHVRAGRYELVFANNGVEALKRLKQESGFAMVITDINMPEMDGLTLLGEIFSVDPNMHSVIISAYGDMQNIRTAMNRGAFDFVTKPLDFADLQITIERTLLNAMEWQEVLGARDRMLALQQQLDFGRVIQESAVPRNFPLDPRFRLFGCMATAWEVGGDYYDVIHLADEKYGLVIADVSDKGIPAAMTMMSVRSQMRAAALLRWQPGEVLRDVNELLCDDNDAVMFVTALYVIYDPASGELNYANGGHNPPLLVHRDGNCEVLALTGGVVLGVAPGLDYDQASIKLTPGDAVLLYTDGLTEAENTDGEQFGMERLQDVFVGARHADPQEITEVIIEAVGAFVGAAPQHDDLTCLTLTCVEVRS
jgi:sigma-B regulation protein RsbU (phosphoserine phosphatase)